MKIGDYQFHCTLQQDATLPPYKGSTFRGGFGSALKQTLCALRRQDCPVCLLRETCLYARVFEAQSPAASGARLAARPHPYVIRPAA
ncbi:MAG: CRISPR-associated protein Cas6, partial [Deltaproteobacteria bacterium]|nr:CRISPR-associated protein Cas6 [Deltaproteobacteria bacterium]